MLDKYEFLVEYRYHDEHGYFEGLAPKTFFFKDAVSGKGSYNHLKWIDYASSLKLDNDFRHLTPLLLDLDISLFKEVKLPKICC